MIEIDGKTFWRAHAKIIEQRRNTTLVEIPAMVKEACIQEIDSSLVHNVMEGNRFWLYCTLNEDDFAVARYDH